MATHRARHSGLSTTSEQMPGKRGIEAHLLRSAISLLCRFVSASIIFYTLLPFRERKAKALTQLGFNIASQCELIHLKFVKNSAVDEKVKAKAGSIERRAVCSLIHSKLFLSLSLSFFL